GRIRDGLQPVHAASAGAPLLAQDRPLPPGRWSPVSSQGVSRGAAFSRQPRVRLPERAARLNAPKDLLQLSDLTLAQMLRCKSSARLAQACAQGRVVAQAPHGA